MTTTTNNNIIIEEEEPSSCCWENIKYKTLLLQQRGEILIVALNRPKQYNAFNDELYSDLTQLLRAAAKNNSVGVIVLTGRGKYFSSGADLKDSFLLDNNNSTEEIIKMEESNAGKFMFELINFPKMLVAAVNGPAVGIGVTLLMHCDVCYMSSSSTLWVPFSRLALVPEFASSLTFYERMGLSNANELLLLGTKIDASKALQWNICSQIFDDCHDDDDDDDTDTNSSRVVVFHPQSIASIVAKRIQDNLLSLPLGSQTSNLFISMIRARRRQEFIEATKSEFVKLDERFLNGDVLEAASNLTLLFGKSKM